MAWLAALVLLAAVAALSLWLAISTARDDAGDADEAVAAVEALLPQIQCERCGFSGCRPYAEALVHRKAAINRCPPGGEALIGQLSELLGEPPVALDTARGEPDVRHLAFIREEDCIGCTKCLAPCPTDAIVGAQGMLHQVLADRCTGCGLCLPPCPVDCIELGLREAAA